MAGADDRQAVLRLGVADRVAAREDPAGLADLRRGPSKTAARVSPGSSSGNAAIDSANRTRPPIAKMSVSAFAAAISPYVRGSSTSGGKKSRVPRIASSGGEVGGGVVGRVKAGDELVGGRLAPSPLRASASRSAPSFAAQPPQW